MINSALLSAQQRKRCYWTNIPGVTQTVPTAIYMAIDSGNMMLAWLWVITIIALSFLLLLFTRTKANE